MPSGPLQGLLDTHANLRGLLERYPTQAAPLSQTLIDLTHASRWQHLCLLDMAAIGEDTEHLESLGKALIVGLRPEAKGLEAVWCCSISDMLNSSFLHSIFAKLDETTLSAQHDGKELALLRTHFLLAVHSPDATVVYYNMARGLIKPVN